MKLYHIFVVVSLGVLNAAYSVRSEYLSGYQYETKEICEEGIIGMSSTHIYPTECSFYDERRGFEVGSFYEKFGCEFGWGYQGAYYRCIDSSCSNCTLIASGDCIPANNGKGFVTLVCPLGIKFYVVVFVTVVGPLLLFLVFSGVVLGAMFILTLLCITVMWGCLGAYLWRFVKEKFSKRDIISEEDVPDDDKSLKSLVRKLWIRLREVIEKEGYTKKKD